MAQLTDRQIIDAGKGAYEYAKRMGADMPTARDFEMYYRGNLYDDDGEPVDDEGPEYRQGYPLYYAVWEKRNQPAQITGPSAWYFTSTGKRRKR